MLFRRARRDGSRRYANGGHHREPCRRFDRSVTHFWTEAVLDGDWPQVLPLPRHLLAHEFVTGHACLPVKPHVEYHDGEEQPEAEQQSDLTAHCGPVYLTTSAVTSSYCSAP